MAVHETARALRVGGQTVPPGEARVVTLLLPDRPEADALPVWVAAGARPGPRITILGAPRGFEVMAARVAAGLREIVDPSGLQGGLVVVPVFRPGGRFAARGQALSNRATWRFPGDTGGNRRAREAFTIFSEVAVGSSLVLMLTAADPGSTGPLTLHADCDDPRVRHLTPQARTEAVVHAKPAAGSLTAAAREMGAIVMELRAPAESSASADGSLLEVVLALLAAAGAGSARDADLPAPAPGMTPALITSLTTVRAPLGGLLERVVSPGAITEGGAVLARIVHPLLGRAVDVVAPHPGLVLQAITRQGVRARAPLFVIGRMSRAETARARRQKDRRETLASLADPSIDAPVAATGDSNPLRVGWVERVSLPTLGVERLRAKIDTGARTSALHVTRMAVVGTTDGPHRRSILELTLPAGSRRGAPPATVRVLVRDYVQVKDTSGRTERRPVIETTLRLGTLERRIRVTLTNRGDMLFPLLIGRTALGPGVVVDPARRLLLLQQWPAHSRTRAPRKQIASES